MATQTPSTNTPRESAQQEMTDLRRWAGTAKEFWPRYLVALAGLTNANKVVILLQDNSQGGKWKRLGDWSSNKGPAQPLVEFAAKVESLAVQCLSEGDQATPVSERREGGYALAFRLRLQRAEDVCVAILLVTGVNEMIARECLVRRTLVADVPASFQANLTSQQARSDVEKFAATLDIMVLVNAEKRFLATAMALCNGVATRFNCERVSLGWLENGYIRLRTISRTE